VRLRALESKGMLKSINGQIAAGWLIVEDLVMVLVLVLLPALSEVLSALGTTQSGSTPMVEIWRRSASRLRRWLR
jgi:monovalent cation:H+ antiporter-2, CPA2 family